MMGRTRWELPEIIAGSILVAVAALGVGGLGSGIVSAALSSDSVGGDSVAQMLTQATSWAGVFAAFMVVAGLFVIWWQADNWSGAFEPVEPAEVAIRDAFQLDEGTRGGRTAATGHLLRATQLAFWAARVTGVIAVAAIVDFVALQVQQGPVGESQYVWPMRVEQIGELVAALVLCAAGILGAVWIRRLCISYLPDAVEGEEELEL